MENGDQGVPHNPDSNATHTEKPDVPEKQIGGAISEALIKDASPQDTLQRIAHGGLQKEDDRATQPLEERMSQILNSERFAEQLAQFPDDQREKAVGWAIEYMTLMREDDDSGLSDYMGKMKRVASESKSHPELSRNKADALIDTVAKKLDITDIETDDAKEQLVTYFRQNAVEDGYYYHSFNGTFTDSIREHGLDPNIRNWDIDELRKIAAIGQRVGIGRLFGWAFINSEGKISVGNETDNIYPYADSSPEWFAQFIAEGSHIPHKDPRFDKKAFAKRDYEAAKQNLELLCDTLSSRDEADVAAQRAYPNLTLEERVELLQFFEKHWQ